MDNLTDLFKLIEITRAQPQYGYALSGIPQDEQSNLAEHHYLVAFIAWQLALHVQSKGANIDVQKVMEFALIHDLGELFGGDIAMPYARINPVAREKAKAFEAENQKFLAKFFGAQSEHFQSLSDEVMDVKTDEGIIAKVADYMEVTHYKFYKKLFSPADMELVEQALQEKIAKMTDEIAKQELSAFVTQWAGEWPGKNVMDILRSK